MGQTASYDIVGAGSAVRVLANRLSADPTEQQRLLEAGIDHNDTRTGWH